LDFGYFRQFALAARIGRPGYAISPIVNLIYSGRGGSKESSFVIIANFRFW